jgi:hypothetical protein
MQSGERLCDLWTNAWDIFAVISLLLVVLYIRFADLIAIRTDLQLSPFLQSSCPMRDLVLLLAIGYRCINFQNVYILGVGGMMSKFASMFAVSLKHGKAILLKNLSYVLIKGTILLFNTNTAM